jgi:hypothetical protein
MPLAARAQQAMRLVAVVNSGTEAANARNIVALRQGLKEAGSVEGQNIAMRLYWANNKRDQLPTLVANAVADKPAVIVSNSLAGHEAKLATTTVPIVFTSGSDPVRDGLVASLNRPGGNVTGIVCEKGCRGRTQKSNARNFGVLPQCRHRPRCRRATKPGYELPSCDANSHLIRPQWEIMPTAIWERISRRKLGVCDVIHSPAGPWTASASGQSGQCADTSNQSILTHSGRAPPPPCRETPRIKPGPRN